MSDVRQWTAPGRIDLLGDHDGPVLCLAVDRGVQLKARLRDDDLVRVWTTLGGRQSTEFALPTAKGEVPGWASCVADVFASLADSGYALKGADLVIEGNLPSGAGLSTSDAVQAVVATALDDLLDLGLDPGRGTKHLPMVRGTAEGALLIESAKEPPTVEAVETDWAAAGLVLAVIDTHTRREVADVRVDERRGECRLAAEELGIDRLTAAGPDAVLKLEDETLKARTRHVITETARTRGAVRALRSGNWTQFAAMLSASHASLKEDFAISRMELDIAAEAALEAGALGARMIGSGFGGSVVALIGQDQLTSLAERVKGRFAFHEFAAPEVFTVRPSGGAHELKG